MPCDSTYGIIKFIKTGKWNGGLQGWRNEGVKELTNERAGGVGKKLGFVAQEMGREINTLGSKSNQSEMQILVVKMKDLLEQIKEQVLNVL